MATIGENIRRERKKKNITQKELGEKVGISNTYLSDMEIGRTNPSIKTLKKIAQGLDIHYVELLKDTD